MRVTLGFDGIHAPYGEVGNALDIPIRLRDLLKNPLNGDDEEPGDDCKASTDAGSLFEMVNIPLRGLNASFTIKVARDVSESETITARQLLSGDAPLVKGLVPRYDRAAVQLISPSATAIHALSEADIVGAVDFDYGGTGKSVAGIPLAFEWQNAVLEIDTDPTSDPSGAPNDGDDEYTLISKSRDEPATTPLISSNPFSGELPLSLDAIRTVNGVFDAGGKTDTYEETTYLNGQVTRTVRRTYGFVYTSVDIFDVADYLTNNRVRFIGSSAIPWLLTREEISEVKFDSEGYEIERTTTGFELTRAKQESEIECLELIKKISKFPVSMTPAQVIKKDALIANLALYGVTYTSSDGTTDKFISVPIAPSTTYSLAPLSKYYGDIPAPDNELAPIARFAESSISQEDTIQTIPDPESTDKNPLPPIVFGRYQVDKNSTEIVSANAPEIFETRSRQETRESNSLSSIATSFTFSQNAGRPSVHNRLEKRLKCKHPKEAGDKNKPKYKYLISTVSHPTWATENGAIKFEGAYTFEAALAAAKLKAKIENMESLSVTIELRRTMPWRVWDTVYWRGRQWKVATIDQVELSQNAIHSLARYSATLKIWLEVPLLYKKSLDGRES
jgi:hypothetical protein